MRYILLCAAFLFCFALAAFSPAEAVPTHLDKTIIRKGCSECHKGHGKSATMMLSQAKSELCFSCHGPASKNAAGINNSDVYSVIMKSSNHPIIQTSQYHKAGERLPEDSVGGQRHVSCFDCHNVHKSEKGNIIRGLRGYVGRGIQTKQANYEYELCYNCHSDQGNSSSGTEGDVSSEFERSNASFHPVESFGRNSFVPSLRRGYSASSTITCTACHGNDDPYGPKGPHGSLYSPILKYRYIRTPGPESSSTYELCYSCHDRNSIINDQSFKAHKIHVVYNQTSCAQCHNAHGSRSNRSLINFDTSVVLPNSFGEITYLPAVQGRPRCYLTCHVNGREAEHKLDEKLVYNVNKHAYPDW